MEGGNLKDGIFLWCVPRSLSTAFYVAMSNNMTAQCHMEPYYECFASGSASAAQIGIFTDEAIGRDTLTRMENLTQKLETEQKHMKNGGFVFVKEMAKIIIKPFGADALSQIPGNFKNTFLIRTPQKAIRSVYAVAKDPKVTGFNLSHFKAREYHVYKHLYELFQLVSGNSGTPPIVVDADDLITDPEGVLREYCKQVDIPYQPSMLNWGPDWGQKPTCTSSNVLKVAESGWFNTVLQNTTIKNIPEDKNQEELPAFVQQIIQESMPYYEKMYAYRLQVAHK